MSRNNQILLDEIIKQEKVDLDYTGTLSDFFEFYSALQVLKDYELSYDEITSGIAGESHDGGADSIFLFVNGDLIKDDKNEDEDKEKEKENYDRYKKNVDIELVIIQSKLTKSFSEEPLLKISRLCRSLFDLDFDRKDFEGRYNDRVLSSFELFKKTYLGLITKKPNLKVSIYYVSQGIDVHINVRNQANDLVTDIVSQLPSAKVDVNFVGAESLVKKSQERPNDVFRLRVTETPISTSEQVFIALTNLSNYYKFISHPDGKLIKHIFESNVRDYQGKTNVNNEIRETLENLESEEFWWLNNGVTILASEVTAAGGKELVVHNPEIVNGLQTSSEIHRFYSSNTDRAVNEKRDILIRVIVPENEETRDRIIRATNSQTPIPKSSLRATDQVHRQIEEYLKPRGLYYDRRKNFYKNQGRKPKEIVSVPFVSQCLMSVLMQEPNSARARPSTLLEDDVSYSKLFHNDNELNTYYLVSLWGRRIEVYLKDTRNFNSTEISNIKFYVLYSVCCLLTGSAYPNNKKISIMSADTLTNEIIDRCIILVNDIYQRLGGTDKTAKGSLFREELKLKIAEEIEIK